MFFATNIIKASGTELDVFKGQIGQVILKLKFINKKVVISYNA